MQLTNCEYTLDKAKVIFMYTSDDRVDFRELLKELAVVFKCRIELRQIGPRDKAKVIGGIGTCGLPSYGIFNVFVPSSFHDKVAVLWVIVINF